MKVVLSNAALPQNGVATIPLPIPKADYDNCIFILNALEIGSQFHADCKVEEISADAPILQCLVGSNINIDELDYLVKRMESFDKRELGQFQAVASSQDIHTVQDFINLTFCCQNVTIVQDFSDLKRIGEFCHMDRNGGTMSQDDAQNMNFEKVALDLLQSNEGRITPYGVIYDKDFQMEQLYDGQHFPQYRYEDCVMEVEVSRAKQIQADSKPAYFCLPMPELQMERALHRSGYGLVKDIRLEDDTWICDKRIRNNSDPAHYVHIYFSSVPIQYRELAKYFAILRFLRGDTVRTVRSRIICMASFTKFLLEHCGAMLISDCDARTAFKLKEHLEQSPLAVGTKKDIWLQASALLKTMNGFDGKLGVGMMMNIGINMNVFWGIACIVLAIKTPRFLSEFMVPTGGGGAGVVNNVYHSVRLVGMAKNMIK